MPKPKSPLLAVRPDLGRSGSHTSARSSRSHRRGPSAQQSAYVDSGNPFVPRLSAGLAERELIDSAQVSDDERSDDSRSRSLSPPPAYGATDNKRRSDSRSPSRPVGGGWHGSRSTERESERRRGDSDVSDVSDDESEEFDNLRDGSLSRRPAWRRPSPKWVLPFVLGVTLSMGMTAAVRTELYLDLACLVHPPRMNEGVHAVAPQFAPTGQWVPAPAANVTAPIDPGLGVPVLSPGDRWFREAQRDIFRWRNPTLPAEDDKKGKDDGEPLPLPSDPSPGKDTPSDTPANPPPGQSPGQTHPFPEIDPKMCRADKEVQRLAAKISMAVLVAAGVLCALTTGFWATVSDRVGRRKILAMVELGLMVNDACFLTIATYPRLVVQTNMYILLLGPVLDGCLGGFSTITAAMHAYITDVTSDGSRATAFGRLSASLMVGMMIGPALGSTVIRVTGNILAPFYFTVVIHASFALLLRFLLPESLSSEARVHLKKRAAAAADRRRERDAAERAWERTGDGDAPVAGESSFSRLSLSTPMRTTRTGRRAMGATRRTTRRALAFLQHLEIFRPQRRENGTWDYNLLLIALSTFILAQMMGVLQMKIQYATFMLDWTNAQIGPYLSFMSACRLTVLLGVLPLTMYFLKPIYTEPQVVEQVGDEELSFARGRDAGPSERSALLPTADRERSASPAPARKPKRSAKLDLVVLRSCFLIETLGLLALGANFSASEAVFLIASAFMSLGTPGGPACNSLALNFIPNKGEAGRLFGALGVLQAIGASVISPVLFANIYRATLDTMPSAIFFVAAGMLVLAQAAVWSVRPPTTADEGGRGRRTRRRSEA